MAHRGQISYKNLTSAFGAKRKWAGKQDSLPRSKNDPKQTFRLLSDLLARPSEVRRKIFKLRQAVPHRQDGLSIVDVNTWDELERRKCGRKHIYQTERRVIGHQMASAFFAELALTHWRLLKHANMLCPGSNPHRIRFPKRESVDRSARPRTA